MANNFKFEGWRQRLPVPVGTLSNDPVQIGFLSGVSITERNATDGTSTVQLYGVFEMAVKGVDGMGNKAIAVGDPVYFDGLATPKLNADASGYLWGIAQQAVNAGATTTILVRLNSFAGVGGANIPPDFITPPMIAAPLIKQTVIVGGAAGAHTVTGIGANDYLVGVVRLNRDATAANIDISSITGEFTVTGANTVDNTGGTDTTGDSLLITWQVRT